MEEIEKTSVSSEKRIKIIFFFWFIPALLFLVRMYAIQKLHIEFVYISESTQYVIFVIFQIGLIASIISTILGLEAMTKKTIRKSIKILAFIPSVQWLFLVTMFGPSAGIFGWLFITLPIKSW